MERLVMEEFGVFMYNGGRGMEVTRTEFLKWKFRNVPKEQVWFKLLLCCYMLMSSNSRITPCI